MKKEKFEKMWLDCMEDFIDRYNERYGNDGEENEEEVEEVELPQPCVNCKEKTVKDLLLKVDEKLNELKDAIQICRPAGEATTPANYNFDVDDFMDIAEEAADTITAITTLLEKIGIKEEWWQAAQARVNAKNKERGYY